uniref:T9SS type A sorting domain-containing protein n=1 Tax=candidate division WOR-3 bacterium TaxID=2052148 RepID=A0A7C4GES2_UNCW3
MRITGRAADEDEGAITSKPRWFGWVLVALLAALVGVVRAQTTFIRTYGGSNYDCGESVRQTSDGGYIIVGNARSFSPGSYQELYIVRTDAQGNQRWAKTYGDTLEQTAEDVLPTADGGFMIVGFKTVRTVVRHRDIWLLRTNASGDTLWTRRIGLDANDAGNSIVEASDGGYVIVGQTGANDAAQVCLVKVTANGSPVWNREFGGARMDYGCQVRRTADNGYVVAGVTYDAGYPYFSDVLLLKTDSAGLLTWSKTIGDRWSYEFASSVLVAEDNGYVILGSAERLGPGGYTPYLIRTNASGDTLWTKCPTGSGGDGYSVCRASDGGYVMTGSSGRSDLWLHKVDNGGTNVWSQTYFSGLGLDWGQWVEPTSDGGYAVAGFTNSVGQFHNDVVLLKTAADGTIGIEEPRPQPPADRGRLLSVTSVNATRIGIRYHVPEHGKVVLGLYDHTGRSVAELVNGRRSPGSYSAEIVANKLPSGSYFCRLQAGGFTETSRLVVVRETRR